MADLIITRSKNALGHEAVELAGVVDAPVRALWNVVADTGRINQAIFELPPLEVRGREGDRWKAQVTVAGVRLELEEHPWAYQAPHRYKSTRRFTDGPLESLDTSCELAEEGQNKTHVTYRITLASKGGPVAWAVEKVLLAKIESGVERLKAALLAQHRPPRVAARNPDADAVRRRAQPLIAALSREAPAPLVHRLLDTIANAPEGEAGRIRPYALAEEWGEPRRAVLDLCLHAVGVGLLEMRWDVLCNSCRNGVHSVAHLAHAPQSVTCPVCEVESDVAHSSNVEAAFAPVAAVRATTRSYACLGSPMMTPHWIAQLILDPDAPYVLQADVGAGRYLVQSPGVRGRTLLDVGENGEEAVRITLEGARGERGPALPAATPVLRAGRIRITLKNEDDRTRRVQMLHEDFGDLAATAAHVVTTPAWLALQRAA